MKLPMNKCRWCSRELQPEEGVYNAGRHFCSEYHEYVYRKWYMSADGEEPENDEEDD